MKISAQIAGTRNEADITVPVSLSEGKLEFEVPNVARSASCSFSVDLAELKQAVEYLAGSEKVDDGVDRLTQARTRRALAEHAREAEE